MLKIVLDKSKKNNALDYIPKIKSNFELVSTLYNDIKNILYNGCAYYPNIVCNKNDLTLFNLIKDELFKDDNIVSWSKHHKIDNPIISETFTELVEEISKFFNIEVMETRLNYYTDEDWKPFHHDSHAYSNKQKEDITIGCSLGSSRDLAFRHIDSNIYFNFPQHNGDIFLFDDKTNIKFQHGVPKLKKKDKNNIRISVIIWGKKIDK